MKKNKIKEPTAYYELLDNKSQFLLPIASRLDFAPRTAVIPIVLTSSTVKTSMPTMWLSDSQSMFEEVPSVVSSPPEALFAPKAQSIASAQGALQGEATYRIRS